MISPTVLAAVLTMGGAASLQDGPIVSRDRLDRSAALPAARATDATIEATTETLPAPFVLTTVSYNANAEVRALVEPAVQAFLGRTLDAQGVLQLRAAVSGALGHAAAFPIVAIDTSASLSGRIRITAAPGRVGRVGIYGDTAQGVEPVRRYAARLAGEAPLTRQTGERYLSLIADIPGTKTTLQTAPSSLGADAIDLGFDIDFKRWETEATINNRGSRTLGHVQSTASIALNSGLKDGDQTRVSITLPSDFDRFQYVTLGHRQPIGYDGMALSLSAGRLRTRVEGQAGDATTASAVISWPLVRSYRSNVVLSGGLDGLNSENAIFNDIVATERTRVARAAVAWNETWSTASVNASLTVSRGIDGLGARADAFSDADFLKTTGRFSAVRALGRQVRLTGAMTVQWSDARAPASELFSLGGAEFGRGFAQGLLVGDSGYGAKVEAAWRPSFLPRITAGSEVYAFADGGAVTVNGRANLSARSEALASAGIGVRLAVGKRLLVEVEGARVLEDPRPYGGDDERVGFGLTAVF